MGSIATVDITDFDKGVVTTLGGKIITITVDRGTRGAYAVDVKGVKSKRPSFDGQVPVLFAYPEDVFQDYILPCFIVRRGDPAPAFDRSPWWGFVRKPSTDAKKFKVKVGDKEFEGYTSYDSAWKAIPFNMTYDVNVLARTTRDGLKMLQYLLANAFRPPYSSVEVYDSNEDRRLYDAGPISISNTSELADVANRVISWTVSFEIQGELDLVEQDTASIDNEDHKDGDSYIALEPILDINLLHRS